MLRNYVKKLNQISLSNDTVSRISAISADIVQQVVDEIKCTPCGFFSMQLDKSTDIANFSQLLVYVRYI